VIIKSQFSVTSWTNILTTKSTNCTHWFDPPPTAYDVHNKRIKNEWKLGLFRHVCIRNEYWHHRPAMMALCGSVSLSASEVCLNDPVRCAAAHGRPLPWLPACAAFSRSRCCFLSRQIVNAQPTAWLSRSPYHKTATNKKRNQKVIGKVHLYSATTAISAELSLHMAGVQPMPQSKPAMADYDLWPVIHSPGLPF